MSMHWEKDVAIRKSTEQLTVERDLAIKHYGDGLRIFELSEAILKENGSYGLGCDHRVMGLGTATQRIDREFWRIAFKRTGLTALMDKQACDEFHNSLEKDPPGFTMDNIQSTFLMMHQDAEMMFRRGIVNTFKSMSQNYWTNNHEPYVIGKKSIVSYMFESDWNGGHRLGYHKSSQINDVDRVVKTLDHQKWEPHELETRINDAMKGTSPGIYEDDYYHIKAFKNQNGHLTIKRTDLLGAINREMAAFHNHDKLAEAA